MMWDVKACGVVGVIIVVDGVVVVVDVDVAGVVVRGAVVDDDVVDDGGCVRECVVIWYADCRGDDDDVGVAVVTW